MCSGTAQQANGHWAHVSRSGPSTGVRGHSGRSGPNGRLHTVYISNILYSYARTCRKVAADSRPTNDKFNPIVHAAIDTVNSTACNKGIN